MSLSGSVRRRLSVAGIGALCAAALSPILSTEAISADSNSGPAKRRAAAAKPGSGEPFPYPTLRETSSEARNRTLKTARIGINGLHNSIDSAFFRDRPAPSRSGPVTRMAATREIPLSRGKYASRGGYFTGRRVLIMSASAYTADPAENGGNRSGRTAIGLKIGYGVAAVDPKIIPLGTRLFIEGYGYAVAADTGGAIDGHRIDLAMDSKAEMRRFGRRKVIVHILD